MSRPYAADFRGPLVAAEMTKAEFRALALSPAAKWSPRVVSLFLDTTAGPYGKPNPVPRHVRLGCLDVRLVDA